MTPKLFITATCVLIVGCLVLAAATLHMSEAADKLTDATLHLRDVHDSYVAATNEQNNAAGKYHAAAAELSRINKTLLERFHVER